MLRTFFLIQSALIVVATLVACLFSWLTALSLFMGGVAMMLNFALLAWVWDLIARKKLIALGLFIIVSKYTILAVLLYRILSFPWVQPVSFLVGISMFVFAAVLLGLYQQSALRAQEQE